MEINYRNATEKDLNFLVENRLAFIKMADDSEDYLFTKNSIREYFQNALKENQCDIILAEHKGAVIGTGIVFYYNSVPSKFNIWGKNAYITSMYVYEEYRQNGIASEILTRLLNLAKEKGYHVFFLQESDIGSALYEKFGFVEGNAGMLLKI